eukprot:TRINITY_DN9875_c0_g1_i1.p1 TRINITY_DN9875_c0_g1~~TRINITY_DN9875_c0_g1_i1.p1  ORF type:complete len:472 (-),score=36.18 TRINITY_DN9875_c0_g1_i1:21-1436(-)
MGNDSSLPAGVVWQASEGVSHCPLCSATFGLLHRKHHCRKCGQVVCDTCSLHRKRVFPDNPALVRVCNSCCAVQFFRLPPTMIHWVLKYLSVEDQNAMLRTCHRLQRIPLLGFQWRHGVSKSLFIHSPHKDQLGEGAYANVYRARSAESGELVAVKVLDKRRIYKCKVYAELQREATVLALVDHPHIIRFVGSCQSNKKVFLVMELAHGKELFDSIVERKFLSEVDVIRITRQLLSALDHLHQSGIVHRDLKAENLIVSPDLMVLKVIDFGYARTFGTDSCAPLSPKASRAAGCVAPITALSPSFFAPPKLGFTPCGTIGYAAPEIINTSLNRKQRLAEDYEISKQDIFSAGIVVYVMLCGALPFTDRAFLNSRTHIGVGNKPFLKGPRWEPVSAPAKDAVSLMLNLRPQDRPHASEMLNHTWLKDEAKAEPPAAPLCTPAELGPVVHTLEFITGMQTLSRHEDQLSSERS